MCVPGFITDMYTYFKSCLYKYINSLNMHNNTISTSLYNFTGEETEAEMLSSCPKVMA